RHSVAALQLQQSAQRRKVSRLLVDEPRILLALAIVVVAHCLLQAMDRLGIEQVELAFRAPLVLAADRQRMTFDATLRERCAMTHEHFLRDNVHAYAADARRRPREVLVD